MDTPTTDTLEQVPAELPVLPLRRSVLFPLTLQPLAVDRPVSIESINRALAADRMLFLALQQTEADDPQPVGPALDRHRRRHPPDGQGALGRRPRHRRRAVARATGDLFTRDDLRLTATLTPAPEDREQSIEVDAYVRRLRELIDRAMSLASGLSQELRGDRHGDRRSAAARLPPRQPARHEGRGQAAAARGGPPAGQAAGGVGRAEPRDCVARAEGQDRVAGPAGDDRRAAAVPTCASSSRRSRRNWARRRGPRSASCASGSRRRACPSTSPRSPSARSDRLERMTPASPEYQMIRTYLDWILEVPWTTTTARPPRPGRGAAGPRRGPLRPRQGEGAHRRVPGRPQAEGGHEGADPLLRRRARRGQDVARAVDRARDEPEVRPHLARRRARRGGDPRPPPHVHRRAARAGSSRP